MDKNQELQRVDKKNVEVTPYDFSICPNCGAEEVGKFCPNCGQSNKDFNKPIIEIIGDLLDSINFDIRLLNTVVPLFTKPGFLTQEYFKGRRKKYVPPMRMYMFFSILFFFLAQYTSSDKIKNNILNFNETPNTAQASMVNGAIKDSLNKELQFLDSIPHNNIVTAENITNFDKEKIKQEVLNDSTSSETEKKLIVGGLNASENKDLFYSKFMKNLSYVLFLLMPFFALILATILWRSKMLYVKHLIFSINFHSFVFGFSSLLMILNLILPEKYNIIEAYLLWIIPIYLMLGIKRFYNRKYAGALLKTIGAISIYIIIISIVLVSILLFTASGFYKA